MTDRITSTLLVILAMLACSVAAFAPDAFVKDAGADDASAAVSAPTDPPRGTTPATPATATPAEPAPASVVEGVQLALQNGQWFVAIGGILWLIVGAIKRWGWEPSSRWGKYALAAVLAGGTVAGLAAWSGAGFSWALVGSTVVAMATAAWAYHGKRDIVDDE